MPKRKKKEENTEENEGPPLKISATSSEELGSFAAVLGLDLSNRTVGSELVSNLLDAVNTRGGGTSSSSESLLHISSINAAHALSLMNNQGQATLNHALQNVHPSWPSPLLNGKCSRCCLLLLSQQHSNLLTDLCGRSIKLHAAVARKNSIDTQQKRTKGVYDRVSDRDNGPLLSAEDTYANFVSESRKKLEELSVCAACSKRILGCSNYRWSEAKDYAQVAAALPEISVLANTPCNCGHDCAYRIPLPTLTFVREKYLAADNKIQKASIIDLVLAGYNICYNIAKCWVPLGHVAYRKSIHRAMTGGVERSGMIDYRVSNPPANSTSVDVVTAIEQHLYENTTKNPEKGTLRPVHYEKNSKKALHKDFNQTTGLDVAFSTWKGIIQNSLNDEELKFLRMKKDHNKCPYCYYMEELFRSIEIDLKTTENEEERLKLLQQLIDNKRDYERHIGRDVEMRKITHWLQDKAVLHETGEQRSYDERTDYENWKIFTKIHCMLREAIESVWKIIAHPATSMEPCLVPTVSDNKGIVETSIFDIIFQG